MLAGHGPNIGHGYVKYIIIDQHGTELEPIIFPSQVARARGPVAGALGQAQHVEVGGNRYWVGADAEQATDVETRLSQDRLADLAFIPALVAGAVARLGSLNGSSTGVCVSGLPATWAEDTQKCHMLGQRLRTGAPEMYKRITIIAEPLGLAYSALLDNNGQVVGPSEWTTGRIATVDLGHLTVDRAELLRLAPIKSAMGTYQLGTARPLAEIAARLSAHLDRDVSLVETDAAIRAGAIRSGGRDVPLPLHWDRPLIENGRAIADRLIATWNTGGQFEAILLGGGGAELEQLTEPIRAKLSHAVVVERPQTAIARGYARLARRQAAAL